MDTKKGIPILTAWDWGNGIHCIAWCMYCKRYHWHGLGDGHRWAHCPPGTPYMDTGYILQVVGLVPPEIREDTNRKKPRGPQSCGYTQTRAFTIGPEGSP